MLRAWERARPPTPRKMGATTEMLRWLQEQFRGPEAAVTLGIKELGERVDCLVAEAAVKMALFFLYRTSEYCRNGHPDFGKVLRGADVVLRSDSTAVKASG